MLEIHIQSLIYSYIGYLKQCKHAEFHINFHRLKLNSKVTLQKWHLICPHNLYYMRLRWTCHEQKSYKNELTSAKVRLKCTLLVCLRKKAKRAGGGENIKFSFVAVEAFFKIMRLNYCWFLLFRSSIQNLFLLQNYMFEFQTFSR